jgi:hypothetical protein
MRPAPDWLGAGIAFVFLFLLPPLCLWLDLKRKQRQAKRRHPAKGTLTIAQQPWLLDAELAALEAEFTGTEGNR